MMRDQHSANGFSKEKLSMDEHHFGKMDAASTRNVDGMLAALGNVLEEAESMSSASTVGESAEAGVVWENHQQGRRSHDDGVRQNKRYKATYYQRRDEIDALKEEAALLENMLSRMKQAEAATGRPQDLVDLYRDDIKRTNLQSAGAQAFLSSYHSAFGSASPLVPTAMYLHLPVDSSARRDILNSTHGTKLRTAMRYLAERTGPLDLRQRHRHLDVVDLPGGDMISTGLDIIQFKSGHSVRQVFDEFMLLVSAHDIESRDDICIGQARQVTPLTESLSIESNAVVLSTCLDGNEAHPGHAFVTFDYVDQDDLHPYSPETYIRQELTAAFLMKEIFTPTGRIVSIAGWAHVRFRPPQRELTAMEKIKTRAYGNQWRDGMPRTIRKSLARHPPAPL